jgi:antitoxin component YwqK of YwqJK toxin-antitoxin module
MYKDNQRDGFGVFYQANGSRRQEGEWKDGMQHGLAIWYAAATGDRYEGYCQRDKRHGCGVRTFINNDRFEGTYQADKRHGYGVFYPSWGVPEAYRFCDDVGEVIQAGICKGENVPNV